MEFPRSLKKLFSVILLSIATILCLTGQNNTLISPEDHFGYKPGSDGNLFTYEELIEYMEILDKTSGKIKLVDIGKSPMGKPMYIAFISDEENINNLDSLKEINRQLALNPDLSDNELNTLIEKGKVFVLATLSMHSSEVGPSQSAPLIAFDLITTTDENKIAWLNDVIYMMVPCHNPDGMDMIVNHYKKYKGTKYEGSSLPRVYHKYVGHDNNRDFVTLSQEDTKNIARIYNLEWFPQVMVEKHQMGSTSSRYFVPPPHDPIAENVDAELWNWIGIFGSNMIKDMTREGLAGVSQHYMFDDYWPGSTETCIWKNVIGMLTEGASAKVATPVYVEPTELGASGKGLSEYKMSINMPMPWEGGWWKLSDLIEYEIVSTMSILKTAANHKEDILRFRNIICQREVHKGKNQPPYYYILPEKQHDQSELVHLVNLLKEQGITVYQLSSGIMVEDKLFNQGDIVVPLAQPFRAFIKEVMETQQYPVRHYTPDGEIIKPYDITSWSLPLHFGVKSFELNKKHSELEKNLIIIEGRYLLNNAVPAEYQAVVFPASNNESYLAVFQALQSGIPVVRCTESTKTNERVIARGSFIIYPDNSNKALINDLLGNLSVSPWFFTEKPGVAVEKMVMPKMALVETNFHDMDAGWTRFVFDTYHLPYKVLKPGDFEKTDFVSDYDVVIFPNAGKSILMQGKYGSEDNYYITDYPPEYTKGIGKEGMKKLMAFVDAGGNIISWGRSTSLFEGTLTIEKDEEKDKEEFQLPCRDISEQLSKKGLFCPGSLVKMEIVKDHPITLGMEKEIGVFYRGRPVFSTAMPVFDMDRRVMGKTPEKNVLVSGYMEKEKLAGNKAMLIWMKKGKGQFVLFAFNPQFRASTHISYKLLFNSILLPKL